jgi:hypothetical protein
VKNTSVCANIEGWQQAMAMDGFCAIDAIRVIGAFMAQLDCFWYEPT